MQRPRLFVARRAKLSDPRTSAERVPMIFAVTCGGLALPAIALGLIFLATEKANCEDERPPAVKEPALRRDLLNRFHKDQTARRKRIALAKERGLPLDSPPMKEVGKSIREEIKAIDADNCRWLTQIVDKHGWPGRTLVGPDGANAAFLLVQHADGDVTLQEKCLCSMQAAPKGEVSPADFALLTDRVRLAKGQKQLYGSQVEAREGRWQVRGEVEQPETLNHRRRKMGLPPIEEYLRLVEQVYGKPTKSEKGVK